MPTAHRRVAATLAIVALIVAAVALVRGGTGPVRAFIAEVGRPDDAVAGPATGARDRSDLAAADTAGWDPDDPAEAEPSVWEDAAVKPIRIRLIGHDQAPVAGVPVVVLGAGGAGAPLAGPKCSNAQGRVRFPIDVAMEQQREIVIAARAVPGQAAWTTLKVALDQPADVTLVVDPGVRGVVGVAGVDGRAVEGLVRVRKAILGEVEIEGGPFGTALSAAFAETTPRGVRTAEGIELAGLRSPEDLTLVVSARGWAPVCVPVRVPAGAPARFPIELKLATRTSIARFEAVVPPELEREKLAFSCHRVEGREVVMAAGMDGGPAQRAPLFAVEVAPDDPQRLEVCAWMEGRVHASAEVEIPALREGEALEVGKVRLEMLPVVLAGHVVDQDQSPLANATVEAIGRGRLRDLAGTTGSDGRFLLRAPPGRGPYQVSAHAAGRASERLTDVPDHTVDLRFVLEPSGSIQGSVIAAAGVDCGRVSVRAVSDGRLPCTTTLLPDGTFNLSGLPRGVYAVVIDGGGAHPIRVTGVVVNPPDTTHDGRLDRLRLRALSGQGQP